MGLLDVFTGEPVRAAAEENKAYLLGSQNNILNANALTRDRIDALLKAGFAGARTDLGAGYGTSGGAIRTGADSATDALDAGTRAALEQLAGARRDLAANSANASLGDLAARFGQGGKLYSDALGINGPQGNARATATFQSAPGYQFTLEQGLDAINRARNARGMANSGNTDVDALKFGTGLADQTYQQWLTSLAPYNSLELGAANSNADFGKTLANLGVTGAGLISDAARQKAAVATGAGTSLADIANKYYAGLSGLDTGEATALGGNAGDWQKTGINLFTNLAPQITRQDTDAANAEVAGSKAFIDSILKSASLALKASGAGGSGRKGPAGE